MCHGTSLQNHHGDPCAGLGIGEGVVMVFKGVAAGGRHGMQLVVGQLQPEMAARGPAGAKELVVRIIHLIGLEHGLEAALIEGTVVGHQGQSGDAGRNLPPHVGKERRSVGIGVTEPMNLLAEPRIVVRSGADERVEGVGDEAATHHHHAHAANAAALSVGGLKVDSCKVVHIRGLQFSEGFGTRQQKYDNFTGAKIGCRYENGGHNRRDVSRNVSAGAWSLARWPAPFGSQSQ